MGFAEGSTWAAWLGQVTPGPAVGVTGAHNRVGIFHGEKHQREKLRLDWAEDTEGWEQKGLRWWRFEYRGDEFGGREGRERDLEGSLCLNIHCKAVPSKALQTQLKTPSFKRNLNCFISFPNNAMPWAFFFLTFLLLSLLLQRCGQTTKF